MPQQSHIAYRVDANLLVTQPEIVLQRMSFKIIEKRQQLLENLLNTKVQFKSNNGIDQGICQSISNTHCFIKVGNDIVKIHMKRLLL